MEGIKLFAKIEKEFETLLQAVRICSENVGVQFGIEKCVMLIEKSGKWQITEGIELPNQEKNKTHGEKETYKYFRILELDILKQGNKENKN